MVITLEEYVNKTMLEAGFNQNTGDVVEFINEKAKKELNRKNGGIDNETVRNWILECRDGIPAKTVTAYGAANKGEATFREKPIEKKAEKLTDKKMGVDAYMESLF